MIQIRHGKPISPVEYSNWRCVPPPDLTIISPKVDNMDSDDYYEEFYLDELEPLLIDVDVLGKPGVYWTVIGTLALVSLFAVTAIWRLAYRLKR